MLSAPLRRLAPRSRRSYAGYRYRMTSATVTSPTVYDANSTTVFDDESRICRAAGSVGTQVVGSSDPCQISIILSLEC